MLARGGVDIAIAEEYEHAPRPHQPELHRDDLEPDELVLTLPRGHAARRRAGGRSARCATCRGRPRARGPTTPTCSCAPAGRAASSLTSTTGSTTSGCCSTSWRSRASRRCSRRSGTRRMTRASRCGRSPAARSLSRAVRGDAGGGPGAPVDGGGGRRDPRGCISPSGSPGSIDAWTFVTTGGPSDRSRRACKTSPARSCGSARWPARSGAGSTRRCGGRRCIARSARWSPRR